MVHTWSVRLASIAGVTRKVLWMRLKTRWALRSPVQLDVASLLDQIGKVFQVLDQRHDVPSVCLNIVPANVQT